MKLLAQFRKSAGFTLIELLIVIALLGALAVGLIGALDPFEQLKKGTDTSTRDIVNQVQTAAIRYYSVKNQMPWCTDAGVCEDLTSNGTLLNEDPMPGAIAKMIAAGEMKSDFETIHAAKLPLVTVFGTGGAAPEVQVCYTPTSKSFRADLNTKFDPATGAEMPNQGIGCDGHTADGSPGVACAWCIK